MYTVNLPKIITGKSDVITVASSSDSKVVILNSQKATDPDKNKREKKRENLNPLIPRQTHPSRLHIIAQSGFFIPRLR